MHFLSVVATVQSIDLSDDLSFLNYDMDDKNTYRDDLKARVEKLETDKDSCQAQLLGITAELSAIKVKLEFIERENDRLLRR